MNVRHGWFIGAIFLTAVSFGDMTVKPRIYLADFFGAKGDGKATDTVAIQRALNACGQSGGGTVRLRPGVYLIGPIFLRSHTELRLDAGATIQAAVASDSFANSETQGALTGLINAIGVKSVAITGNGTIDGGKKDIWNSDDTTRQVTDSSDRFALVVFSDCMNVKYEDVTLQNHLGPHLAFVDCKNINVSGTVAQTPKGNPTADAFVVDSCRDVEIHDCLIDVSGDSVAIKSDGLNREHTNVVSERISIKDCGFLQGRGLTIRNKTSGRIQNIAASNCTFQGGATGVLIEFEPTSGSTVQDLIFRNLKMQDVGQPIRFKCLDLENRVTAKAVSVSRVPSCSNLTIENLNARGAAVAGEISGSFAGSVSNVLFRKCTIAAKKGMYIRNAQRIEFADSSIEAEQGTRLNVDASSSVSGL